MHKTLLWHFLINGIIVDLVLHIGDYHLQWLCVHSLCYQKIKWILRRLLHSEIWFSSARTLLKLLSHCICTANNVWQYESPKEKSFEPAYLSCQIAHLDWVERALSLLTYGMNYGQIKCFLLDLMQWSSAYRANCRLGDDISAGCLAGFAATANDTTSASCKKCCSELLPVYSSTLETLAQGTMKTITSRKSS